MATTHECIQCLSSFLILPEDDDVYRQMEVTRPSLCPDCRERLRTLHINQLNLFARQCDGTGERIISHFPTTSGLKVYSQAYWYSDAVDNREYGREFDFSRSFFEQFADLSLAVPRPALFTDYLRDENSAYTNYAGRNKDCYLIFDSDSCRDCTYSYSINGCTNTAECFRCDKLEQCLECVDSRNCYSSTFLYNCDTCTDSAFLSNCIGCSECLLSSNLRKKRHYVMNEPVSPEQFAALRKELGKAQTLVELHNTFNEFRLKYPQKYQIGFQNENVLGNYLLNCKDVFQCFDCRDLRDGRYCFQTFMRVNNGMDINECGEGELLYECSNLGYNAYNIRFSINCLNQIRDMTYCDSCFNGCNDLFGCIGLKRQEYCILNKQYTKEQYFTLLPRIIEKMQTDGEWGEFFPASLSPFGYNLTIANDFYPLTKQAAIEFGFKWQDDTESPDTKVATGTPPSDILGTEPKDIENPFQCSDCAKPYRVIKQELKLYKTLGIALPRYCFKCRHQRRLSGRNRRKLWEQPCQSCGAHLSAAYDPMKEEVVFCESCYLESLE